MLKPIFRGKQRKKNNFKMSSTEIITQHAKRQYIKVFTVVTG